MSSSSFYVFKSAQHALVTKLTLIISGLLHRPCVVHSSESDGCAGDLIPSELERAVTVRLVLPSIPAN